MKGYNTKNHNSDAGGEHYEVQHNPNAGENHMHYTSSGSSKGGLSAGVEDGLSMVEGCDVKNYEKVCQNQRPKGNRHGAGKGFVIGT